MRALLLRLTGNKRVNGWAVLILAGGLAVLAVAVHFAHGYQVRRNARSLLEQAEHVESAGDLAQAAVYLEQYLGLERGDVDAQEQYARLLNQLAKTDRARFRAFYA